MLVDGRVEGRDWESVGRSSETPENCPNPSLVIAQTIPMMPKAGSRIPKDLIGKF
jgi:hypothetical protein